MTVIEYVSVAVAVVGTIARIALFFPRVADSVSKQAA
jgi:ABC-type enterobactin transport system permease subunit